MVTLKLNKNILTQQLLAVKTNKAKLISRHSSNDYMKSRKYRTIFSRTFQVVGDSGVHYFLNFLMCIIFFIISLICRGIKRSWSSPQRGSSRGSSQDVVLFLWLMQQISPSAVMACSQASGRGPEREQRGQRSTTNHCRF